MYIYIYIYMCVCVCVCGLFVCVCVCICIEMCAYMYPCIYFLDREIKYYKLSYSD